MQKTYKNPIYPYIKSADQTLVKPAHHTVIIIGAGPTGLSMAIDLAMQGIKSVVLDDNNTVSVGSRAICFAKRTLEILNRYGCAKEMIAKGATWRFGKVFFKNDLVYDFNLLAEEHHKIPAFINLQQYYFEEYLVTRCQDFAEIDLRWKNKVIDLQAQQDINYLSVTTPDGEYKISADYVIAADGANSPTRQMLGLASKGQVFQDRFLIADVVMKADFPTERWFWFDPPFNKGQSALLHRQADDVWRIDLQLGWDADPDHEKREEVVRPRIEAMLGKDAEFELEWTSVYTFQCRRMESFIHHQVLFVGDAAHQVSPFGARGANGAIQSVDNLAWKLARVIKGQSPKALLATYDTERSHGADENIINSTRATDFITPKSNISRIFRDEVLMLAKNYPFARCLVNSGRLSLPCCYIDSPLNTADTDNFKTELQVGDVAKDAPVLVNNQTSWLIDLLGGAGKFTLMINIDVDADSLPVLQQEINLLLAIDDLTLLLVSENNRYDKQISQYTCVIDQQKIVQQRYDLVAGSAYLFRPDQVISARWKALNQNNVEQALRKAQGFTLEN